jgi:hypothetical protein
MTDKTNNDDSDKDLKALGEEIDAGVEDAMEVVEQQRRDDADDDGKKDNDNDNDDKAGKGDDSADKDADETPEGETAPEGSDGKDGDAGGAGDDAVTDDHLERAVKAGLTMAEARRFGSASLLDAMVSRLEGKKDGGDKGGKTDAGEDKDPLEDVPDLDPNEYDEKIVNAFKALKGIARQQQEIIKGLRTQDQAATPDWFKAQAAGLDKAVSSAITSDPTKLESIRDKFAVLEAGYKAAGKDASREAVFQEAVRITMGDVISKAAVDDKAAELAKRAKQHINRPAGHRASPKGDPGDEIAAEIDRKYFQKA